MKNLKQWPWVRIASLVGAGIAGTVAVLVPATAPVLGPIAAGLAGIAVPTPGFVSKRDAVKAGAQLPAEKPPETTIKA